MDTKPTSTNAQLFTPLGLLVPLGFFPLSLYSYPLFHTLAEFFSVIVAFTIFIFAWHTRRFQINPFYVFLGIAYLFVGALDFFHTLVYPGMSIFENSDTNTAAQLWIAARFMESVSILLAFFFLRISLNEWLVILAYSAFTCWLLFTIFIWEIFPVCFIEGTGLTLFKKTIEYLIAFFLVYGLFLLRRNKDLFDPQARAYLQMAIFMGIGAELAFTYYIDAYGLSNFIGHICKLTSFYFIYRAIIETGLTEPHQTLFKELIAHRDALEDKVTERTAALQQSMTDLEKEMEERLKAEKDLRWELTVNKAVSEVADGLISSTLTIEEISQIVLSAAMRLTASRFGVAASVDPDTQNLLGHTLTPMMDMECNIKDQSITFATDENGRYPGLWGYSLNTKRGFYTNTPDTHEQSIGLPEGHIPLENYLSAPALIGGEPVGQIALASTPDKYTERDLAAIERLSDIFALSIQRKQMVEALCKSEHKYRSLFDDALDMIHITDKNLNIVEANPMEIQTMGYTREEYIHKPIMDIVHPDYRNQAREALGRIFNDGENVNNFETALVTKTGKKIDVEINAVPQFDNGNVISTRAIIRDISDRKKEDSVKKQLEIQLRQSQKMEAVGTLAGGIAHDFNNILSVILGYTDMVMEKLSPDSSIYADLETVMVAGNRARDLVKQILTFSRQSDHDLQPVKLQFIIKEALRLLRPSIPVTIAIEHHVDPDCGPILADATQLHQVVMNLCTNAYHAMRETGGQLNISLKSVELTADDLKNRLNLQPGTYAKLEVSDTGCGMEKSILTKIFNPYFTTKTSGEGTGFGLSVVHGIVRDIGGDITVYSEPGTGTIFHVYLPVIQEKKKKIAATHKLPLPTGTERIILVDDDQTIAQMNKAMLESLGYKVTAFTDSMEIIEAFRKDPVNFDLILTDMTMPQITGGELAKTILNIRPDIPIILCTGFSELIDKEMAKEVGIREFIMKPATKKELAETIRRVLNGNASPFHSG